jgi:LDH2 family malate/lactate/ureidoglycolate dehydrogenase
MYGNPLSEKRRLGHFCVAINIAAFEDIAIFKRRLSDYCKTLREQGMGDADTRAKVPGDPEKEMKVQRLREGIPVPTSLLQELFRLGEEAGVGETWLGQVSKR